MPYDFCFVYPIDSLETRWEFIARFGHVHFCWAYCLLLCDVDGNITFYRRALYAHWPHAPKGTHTVYIAAASKVSRFLFVSFIQCVLLQGLKEFTLKLHTNVMKKNKHNKYASRLFNFLFGHLKHSCCVSWIIAHNLVTHLNKKVQ